MRIVVEVLIDESQVTEEDVERLVNDLNDKACFACSDLFWYREGRAFDYEVATKVNRQE